MQQEDLRQLARIRENHDASTKDVCETCFMLYLYLELLKEKQHVETLLSFHQFPDTSGR